MMSRTKRQSILDEKFWTQRKIAAQYPHQAIYMCTLPEWEQIEQKHKKVLTETIKDTDTVLDAGCAWGRLLDLLPVTWTGDYIGVDLCAEFIQEAREKHPHRLFHHADLRTLKGWELKRKYDWAILISMRSMIMKHLGATVWWEVEEALKHVADKLLILEYESPNGIVI